jgi:hypothetical protein
VACRAVALLALLPFVATAQDGSAVLEWRQEDTANVAGFRIYYGRAPQSLSGEQQVLDAAARRATVDGLADGTWYFTVTAVSRTAAESQPSNLACFVIPKGSCKVPTEEQPGPLALTVVQAPDIRVSISNVDPKNWGFDLAIDGSGPVTIALADALAFDWCSPRGISGLPTVTPTTPALGDRDDDGNRRQAVTFTAPVARTRCDCDGPEGAAFSGATVTVQGVSKPLAQSNGSWSVQFP